MTKQLPVWMGLCTFVLTADDLPKLEARAGQDPNGYRLTWDDFRNGFDATSPAAKWFYFAAGPFVGDDGIATTSRNGLVVVPTGINAATGEPAFTKTLGQEDDNGGLPGGLDHVKWLVYTNHVASTGYRQHRPQPHPSHLREAARPHEVPGCQQGAARAAHSLTRAHGHALAGCLRRA